MFLALAVQAIIFRAVRPSLNTSTVLSILFPLTNIFCTIHMFVGAESICLIVKPFTFVNVTISVYKYALTIGLIIFPLTFIFGAILPYLYPISIFKPIEQFSVINCPIWQSYWSKCLSHIINKIKLNALNLYTLSVCSVVS